MAIPVIAVTNASTCVSDAQMEAALPALQQQVSQDFKAYWNADCSLIAFDKAHALPEGWWQIVVLDNPDQAGALGYHELAENGAPLGKVFAGLDLRDGYSWTVTLSHELLEMLADPWINWCAAGGDGKIYALEVCDPVEADNLGYEINSVLVSDFVTPAWFESPTVGRVDFKQRISHPYAVGERRIYFRARCEQGLDADFRGDDKCFPCAAGKQAASAFSSAGRVEEER